MSIRRTYSAFMIRPSLLRCRIWSRRTFAPPRGNVSLANRPPLALPSVSLFPTINSAYDLTSAHVPALTRSKERKGRGRERDGAHLSRSGEGDIEPSPICQEPDPTSRVAPYHTGNHDVFFPPFKPVDRLDFDICQFFDSFGIEEVDEGRLALFVRPEELSDESDLGGVWRNDANLTSLDVLE